MNFEYIYKYRLIIVLIIIATAMGVVKFKYRNVKWEQKEVILIVTPSPTISPQINVEYPLWEKLPYKGNGYVVERYTEPNTLLVKVDEEVNEEKVKEEINNLMRENSVATESHKLIIEKQ